MAAAEPIYSSQGILSPRELAERAFSRAAGAPLVAGNMVRILKNAEENYPAWLAAIDRAKRWIHFESYIIKNDRAGQSFAEAFVRKAREGVRVRVIYDWFGGRGLASGQLWKRLRAAGVEVHSFNPPRPDNPLAWLSRDHRKLIVVDGDVGFVGGLCVGDDWVGHANRGIEPWRDTAVELRGPAVADLEWHFADMWRSASGKAVPEEELPSDSQQSPAAGNLSLRVVATSPNTASLYRLEQLIAALARQSIWFTDAYFVATTPFLQALSAAAMDGVDVRMLVPRASDVPMVRALSRAGYRPLLEAGVRVFEWNGSMLHAKTAVVDGRWARVGSSNLNLASWIGNWELDVIVEDTGFAEAMERMYVEDLAHATEIVLERSRKIRPLEERRKRGLPRRAKGSAGRAASGVLAITNTIGAVITRRRTLGPTEARLMFSAGLILLVLAVVGWIWPLVLAIPMGIVGAWVGLTLLLSAYRLWRESRARRSRMAAEDATPNAASPSASVPQSKESQLQSRQ
jgi:cardiolipin synthase A/B